MVKQPKKRTLYLFFCFESFIAGLFFTTCGIEEYYYLPQVPQTNISVISNTSATIRLPPLSSSYANNYVIYYRIYISNYNESGTINTSSTRINISPDLERDFSAINPNTDPTSNTMGTPADTLFKNRSYFILALDGTNINNVLTKIGGDIEILFPTMAGDFPGLLFNGGNYRLFRSRDLIHPEPDRFFRNTSDLNDHGKAIANINADVSSRSGLSQRLAYVSMYIVAAGVNPDAFTPIYSKPTHICVFKLPDS